MTPRRPFAALAVLALAAACPAPPGDTTATAGPLTTDAATTGTSGLSMSATSADAPTTTTDATTTPSTTGTTSDTGCNFLDCETSGPHCAVEHGELRCTPVDCDPWEQDCPEGQKCAPWANDGGNAWNSTKCVDVAPNPGKPGDACTVEGSSSSGVDTCEKAAMCWNVDPDTGEGTCVGFCAGSPDQPMCPEGTCLSSNSGVLNLCLLACDPLQQDCPGMDLCIPNPNSDDFACVLDASGDAGAPNDPCEFINACDPGLVCAAPVFASECDPQAAGCCLPFCDLSNPMCTNQGATCLPWYEMGMAPPGLENVGLCGLML